jgi:hypothetical protein
VEEQTVLYQGLNIAACHWRDVHWPINAPSLDKADFVSHTFDMRWSALRAKYAPGSFAKPRAGEGVAQGAEEVAEDDLANDEVRMTSHDDAPGAWSAETGEAPAIEGADGSGTRTSTKDEHDSAAAADPDQDVIDILNSVRSSSRMPKSHESLPRPGEAEVLGGEVDDPIIKVCEVSYDYDCFEDGIVRRGPRNPSIW